IAASPIVPFEFIEELTSSSWLSFLLPFYSPPNFLSFPPALLAERVFILMYSDTDLSCQEESDVRDKKNEISIPETGKLECAETSARIILQTPVSPEQPSRRRRRDCGLTSAACSTENSRRRAGGWSHPRTGYTYDWQKRGAWPLHLRSMARKLKIRDRHRTLYLPPLASRTYTPIILGVVFLALASVPGLGQEKAEQEPPSTIKVST